MEVNGRKSKGNQDHLHFWEGLKIRATLSCFGATIYQLIQGRLVLWRVTHQCMSFWTGVGGEDQGGAPEPSEFADVTCGTGSCSHTPKYVSSGGRGFLSLL